MIHITKKSEQQGQRTAIKAAQPESTFKMTTDSTDLLLSPSIDAYALDVTIF